MHKLRLAAVLPIVQFVVAVLLLQWGYRIHIPMYLPTADLVCQGLNAPALLSRFPLYAVQEWEPESAWVSRPMLGLYGGDVFFLVGVIVVWFLVGRALDRRRAARTLGKSGVALELVKHSLLLALSPCRRHIGLQFSVLQQYGLPP